MHSAGKKYKGEVWEEEGVEAEGEGKAAAGILGEAVTERGVETKAEVEVDKDGIQTYKVKYKYMQSTVYKGNSTFL